MRYRPHLATLAIGRSTFDTGLALEESHAAVALLRTIDPQLCGAPELILDPGQVAEVAAGWDRPDLVVLLHATFTDARFVAALAEATTADLLLWSFPEDRSGGRLRLNSLCGLNLSAHWLARNGRTCRHLHHRPRSDDAVAAIERAIEAPPARPAMTDPAGPPVASVACADHEPAAVDLLAGSRIAVVGEAPAGFEPCMIDRDEVHRRLGVETVDVRLEELFARADSASDEQRGATEDTIREHLVGYDTIADRAQPSVSLAAGLDALAEDRGVDAVALRCWPECFDHGCGAACTALAALAHNGRPGACEADALGAVTMLLLSRLAGTPAFLADLVDVDASDQTVVFWHCGVAPWSMASPDQPPRARVHPNRGVALTHEFALAPGRVTVARISQSRNQLRLVVGVGEIVDQPLPFSGTAGTVRWPRPVEHLLDLLVAEGLEHHFALVAGDVTAELVALAADWDLPVVRI